ncbi:MAG TPA: DUF2917 domain-containing protein [Candidatus Nitrosotenuis sp.]|nr:DUF2917 domain-containing protein [Candidatus Nitrosotenuis sp.]
MSITLPRQSVLSLRADKVQITCRQGLTWVTQEGDAQDYLLRPGLSFSTAHPGQVVVQALEEARIDVTA